MPDPNKPADPMLAFIGALTKNKRILRYSTINPADLPPEIAQKMKDYRNLLLGLGGAVVVVLVHARLWTLGMAVVVWVAMWRFKSRYEADLDTLLAPYFKDGIGPAT